MASRVSSKRTLRRKDGRAKGAVTKGVAVSADSGSVTVRSYIKKQKYK